MSGTGAGQPGAGRAFAGRPGNPRRRRTLIAAAAVLVIAGGIAIKLGRHHVIPRRFAEVVPGHLYRSGYLEEGTLRRVIDQHGIRTVLSLLNNEPDDPDQRKENAILAERRVRLLRIGMRGDGVAEYDQLDAAADILADAAAHPLLVHCAAGVNRTGAVFAAWRMKHCGWDVERALAEAERHGYRPADNAAMGERLRAYYRERISASRPAG
jgi:protein-tyrosine phosphatase